MFFETEDGTIAWHHAHRGHLPRSSTASIDASHQISVHARARARVFTTDCSGGPGELDLSSGHHVLELKFMCTRPRYAREVFSLACTSRPGSPAPAICRRLGLNLSAGSISTHVVLTLPALRSTPRPTCAAQNGLPRSHVLCCAASVSGSTGQQGRCQPPRPLDRAFFLGCAWPSACALPGMCRGYGRDGVECAVLYTFTMCAAPPPGCREWRHVGVTSASRAYK